LDTIDAALTNRPFPISIQHALRDVCACSAACKAIWPKATSLGVWIQFFSLGVLTNLMNRGVQKKMQGSTGREPESLSFNCPFSVMLAPRIGMAVVGSRWLRTLVRWRALLHCKSWPGKAATPPCDHNHPTRKPQRISAPPQLCSSTWALRISSYGQLHLRPLVPCYASSFVMEAPSQPHPQALPSTARPQAQRFHVLPRCPHVCSSAVSHMGGPGGWQSARTCTAA
jgi:hypothetical protein